MLELKNVNFKFKGQDMDFFRNLSLNVKDGEFVSLIGVSGSGKSTILRLISGLSEKTLGEILLNGKEINRDNPVGYMPQKDLLFPWRTVLDNLCLPMEIRGDKEADRKSKAEETLFAIGLLDAKDKYPSELSGGMRQRVAFGRTILTGSSLLLLDEPFSALDYITRISMQEWLLEKHRELKKTIFFVTHDVEEAIFLSDKIYVIPSSLPVSYFEEVPVDFGRERGREFLQLPEIMALKERLLDELKGGGE